MNIPRIKMKGKRKCKPHLIQYRKNQKIHQKSFKLTLKKVFLHLLIIINMITVTTLKRDTPWLAPS